MNNFHINDLLNTHYQTLDETLPNVVNLSFDDGVTLTTTRNKVTYSSFFWGIYRRFPNTVKSSKHFVSSILKGKPLGSNTHNQILTAIIKDVRQYYPNLSPQDEDALLEFPFKITALIHSKVSQLASEYCGGLDILDFIKVVEHPSIKAINQNVQPNNDSITESYSKLIGELNTNPDFNDNALARAVRSKKVNANQVTQCVGFRGYLTEVDGQILPTPIWSNFTYGLSNLHDYMAESRSAAKSYYFSEAPLEDAEYFARRLGILCMTVERLVKGDCGSTDYLNWYVKPPEFDADGTLVSNGDLNFIQGKYYLDESTNKLAVVKADDKHLSGKYIRMRSVIKCKHPDKHAVCETCFGELSFNMSPYANLGHICAGTMTQQTSQSVLSNKHYQASSHSSAIVLLDQVGKYFTLNKTKSAYIMSSSAKALKPKIVLAKDEARGLLDISDVSDLDNINPARISQIESVDLQITDKRDVVSYQPIILAQGNRQAFLSREFLNYLKTHKWSIDGRGNFVFDLEKWDFKQEMFRMPEVEFSFGDHSKQVASTIESNMASISERTKPESPQATLVELADLVNSKLNVNLACLEVIIYASMTNPRGFDLARKWSNAALSVSDLVIWNRSLGASLAYERQKDTLTKASSFFAKDKPDSPFDVFLLPHEVVKNYKGRDKVVT
jgi:hypothetical protein